MHHHGPKLMILLSAWFVFAGFAAFGWAAVEHTEMAIASKQTKGVTIALTNAEGRLREHENGFCVVFEQSGTEEPLIVRKVGVEFRLLVGRIQENPISAHLTESKPGRYCGQVNLGKQYYNPAVYYAFVSYTDPIGRKRRTRFFVSVKHSR